MHSWAFWGVSPPGVPPQLLLLASLCLPGSPGIVACFLLEREVLNLALAIQGGCRQESLSQFVQCNVDSRIPKEVMEGPVWVEKVSLGLHDSLLSIPACLGSPFPSFGGSFFWRTSPWGRDGAERASGN